MELEELIELSKNLNVLYVEDDENIVQRVSKYLKKLFNEVVIAKDGQEGLDIFEKQKFDLVLTDIYMPKLNGIKMLTKIKEMNLEQNCIIISAYSEPELFVDSIKIGVDGYILKPIEFNQMNQVLIKVIKKIDNNKKIKEYQTNLEKLVEERTKELSLFKKAIDSTTDGIVITKAEDNQEAIYINKAFEKITGYSKDEVLGKNLRILNEKNRNQTQILELKEAIKQKRNIQTILKNYTKDGKEFTNKLTIDPIYCNNNEKIEHFIGVQEDISQIIELEENYQNIFKNSLDGIFLHDLNGVIIDVNPVIEKLHNMPKNEIIGRNIQEFYSKEEIAVLESQMEELLEKGVVNFQMQLFKFDGKPFFADIKSNLIEVNGKKIVQGSIRDISKLKKQEFKIKQLAKVFKNVKEGIILTDKDGVIVEVNKAFCDITEYSYEEAVGNKPSILKSGLSEKSFYETMWKNIIDNETWSGQIYNRKKSGEIYTSFLNISTIKKDREIKNYIGVFTDITKVLEYEKSLREKDILLTQQAKMAAMGEMIDSIAHQWKQPLSYISTYISSLKLKVDFDDLDKDDVINVSNEVMSTVKYMSDTIDDFKNFFNSNKMKVFFQIEKTLDKAFKLMASKMKKNSVEIIQNIQPMELHTYENELVQVILNILNNAIDALCELKVDEKLIFIDININNDEFVIEIKDNAGGIEEEILDKIFEARFTTKEHSNGTGIGLYICKKIIEDSLNGKIIVQNSFFDYDNKNYKGALFKVTIPKKEVISAE